MAPIVVTGFLQYPGGTLDHMQIDTTAATLASGNPVLWILGCPDVNYAVQQVEKMTFDSTSQLFTVQLTRCASASAFQEYVANVTSALKKQGRNVEIRIPDGTLVKCFGCGAENTSERLSKCHGCEIVMYCDAACQETHKPLHAKHCYKRA